MDTAEPAILFFTKALVPGGASADLFADKVEVHGYTNAQGHFVAPHRATRHKKRVVPLVSEAKRVDVQPDLFAAPKAKPAPKPRPKADPRQSTLFDATPEPATQPAPPEAEPQEAHRQEAAPEPATPEPAPAAAPKRPRKHGDERDALIERYNAHAERLGRDVRAEHGGKPGHVRVVTGARAGMKGTIEQPVAVIKHSIATADKARQEEEAPPPPADAAPPEGDKRAAAMAQLTATREGLEKIAKELTKRWGAAVHDAEDAAKRAEPGRGHFFGRGATTWTKRQEEWFHQALRERIKPEEPSWRAALARFDRISARAEGEAKRLGVNEPWTGGGVLREVRDFLESGQGPVRWTPTKGSTTEAMEAAAAPEPKAEEAKPEPEAKPVPERVLDHVRRQLAVLTDAAAGIESGREADRKFQGNGRYEADALFNRQGEIERAHAMLDKFRATAAKQGVDAEAVIRELGGLPDLFPSEQARAWQAGASNGAEKRDTPPAEAPAPVADSAVTEPATNEAAKVNTPLPVTSFGVEPGTTKGERKRLNGAAASILSRKADEEMTQEDREALAKWTGAGGIGDSQSEFYTPPAVASAMWDMLRNAGFRGGEVLEPSCGTGVYLHTAPEGARVTGVEMDPTSARIAKVLHGQAGHEVHASALEHFATQDGRQFDAVIGNVPFCARGSLVKADKPDIPRAEQYFVDTALDKTRDGGLVAVIVPTGIMDGRNTRGFRERILAKGEFLGGVRLPNTAFEAAHTEVTSDILVFRKRPQEVAGALGALDQDQLKAAGVWDAEFLAGSYFEGRGSSRVMGRVTTKMGQFGEEMTVAGSMAGVPSALATWAPEEPAAPSPTVASILDGLGDDASAKRRVTSAALKPPYQTAKQGDVRTINGVRYVLQGQPPRWHRAEEELPEAVEHAQRIAELLEDLAEGRARDARFVRAELAEALDGWVAAHGTPARSKELRAWLAAPHMPRGEDVHPEDHAHHVRQAQRRTARILGAVNDDGSYSDLVTGNDRPVEAADIETHAMRLALEQGGFTADQLATTANAHLDTVLDRLHASPAFAIESDGKTWNTLDGYMTGDLWPKLDAAKAAAAEPSVAPELRAKFAAQAKALEEAIDPKSLEDVEITLNAGFIQPADIEAWFASKEADYQARNPGRSWSPGEFNVSYEGGAWSITAKADGRAPYRGSDAGMVERFLNRDGIRKDEKEKVDALNREFKRWLLGSDRRDGAEERYNRLYRGFRAREFTNSPIHIAGMNTEGLKAFQYGGVRWALAAGKGIIAADVGLGKTVRGLMLAKLAKQTGQAKRPTFVVPKSVLANWMAEAEKWFPGSRVLTIGESYVTGKDGKVKAVADDEATRRRKLQSLSQNDWDFVFISQPAWNAIDVSPELKDRYESDDFWNQRAEALERAKSDKKKGKIKTAFEQQQAGREFSKREGTVYFDGLGIDMLLMDEGHAYKNLFAARQRFGESPKFLGGSGQSKRALDTFHKTRALRDANGGKGVFMLTATPTKNSPLEVYSMLSHIAPEAFERMGIKNAEDFLDRFCVFETRKILGLDGDFDDDLCVTGFKNLGELREVMRRYIDRKTAADVGLELPERQDKTHMVDMTEAQQREYAALRELAENSAGDAEGEAHIFSIMDKMMKATLDLSLINPRHAKERCPKMELCAKEAAKNVADGGQVIFCEAIDVHEKIAALVAKHGIPRERIAILNGKTATTGDARLKISDAFNAGRLDVVIANKTAEEGVNLQKRTADIHHLDLPWEPATLQQRNGRGLRQGNTNKGVRINTYLARGSFDGYRHQTIQAKKDWQDLLWNGGDTVENLAFGGGGSREEMMIALSADPEATAKKLAEDKDAQAERQRAEETGKANEQFARLQEMRRSLRDLRAAQKEGAEPSTALRRLEFRADKMADVLRHSQWFAHKELLDSDEQAFIEPTTGHVWTKGKAFELAGGSDGPIHYSTQPTRWVVEGVDLGAEGGPKITARLWGRKAGEAHSAVQMDAERFKAGVEPVAYSADEEAAHVEAQRKAREAKAQAEAEQKGVTHLGEVADLPPVVMQARAGELQTQLKEAMRAYKYGGWGHQPFPMVAPGGELVPMESYEAHKAVDTHDFMLPTPENREKAIAAYVAAARDRHLEDRQSVGRRGRMGDVNGVKPHFPKGASRILGWDSNPWEAILPKLWGDGALVEAKAQAAQQIGAAIDGASSFREAVAAAQPAITLPGWGYPGRGSMPKEVLDKLWDKAVQHGALNERLETVAAPDSTYGKKRLHAGIYRGQVFGSGYATTGPHSTVAQWLNNLGAGRDKPE